MIAEYTWFERAFTFDLPVWMYPNVVERLRGTPARLEELVASLDTSVLVRRDSEDWSIQENAGHLWDLESLWLGRLDDFLNGAEMLRVADLTNRETYDANHNANTINAILSAFRRERAELVRHLDILTEAEVERTALHPRLEQPMRVLDHAFFVAEHDDHHLAQITRLKRKFSP
ncbi:MAG: DinB family protein [Anaerolineae bacterium]|nr:DinB family protein [Anaerolineae bacterium]